MASASVRPIGDIQSDESSPDLSVAHQYLGVARRQVVPIALILVVLPLVAIGASLMQQHLYRSSADVLLTHDDYASALGALSTPLDVAQDAKRVTDTEASVAATPAVADRALRSVRATGLTPDQFLASSNVTADPNADLLHFSVDAPRRAEAALLATAYAQAYTRYAGELAARGARQARLGVDRQLSELEAAGDNSSPLHRQLVRKGQQLRTMDALATSNAYVVRSASVPIRVQPKPLRNGVLGLALAVVLALGLVAVSQALDTRLYEADEIGEVLRVPLLGRLATRSLRPRAHRLGIATDPFGADAEVARLFKTRVEFAAAATGARTIMVTGDAGHERDASAVAQLAVAFAQGGRHVIVVDADVRAPAMDRVFECPREPGLLDVLAERSSLEEALVPVRSDGRRYATAPVRDFARRLPDLGSNAGSLNILPAGGGPDEAREFVGTSEFALCIAQLRDGADVVLIRRPGAAVLQRGARAHPEGRRRRPHRALRHVPPIDRHRTRARFGRRVRHHARLRLHRSRRVGSQGRDAAAVAEWPARGPAATHRYDDESGRTVAAAAERRSAFGGRAGAIGGLSG